MPNDDVIVGGNRILYISSDLGVHWTPFTTSFATVTRNIISMIRVAGGALYAGTYSARVLRSIDNGVMWTSLQTGLWGN
jgi:hypothetical protein